MIHIPEKCDNLYMIFGHMKTNSEIGSSYIIHKTRVNDNVLDIIAVITCFCYILMILSIRMYNGAI